jgi:hypothetical protein
MFLLISIRFRPDTKLRFGYITVVDLGYHFWNRFATECDYLMMIMREYEADKKR